MRSKEQRSLGAERESFPSHDNESGDDKRYEGALGICTKLLAGSTLLMGTFWPLIAGAVEFEDHLAAVLLRDN